jgi:hypothetical protein
MYHRRKSWSSVGPPIVFRNPELTRAINHPDVPFLRKKCQRLTVATIDLETGWYMRENLCTTFEMAAKDESVQASHLTK